MSDTINAAGLKMVKKWEGLNLTACQCAAGVWTIGWGHTGKVDGVAVAKGMKITKTKAEELLAADLKKFYGCTKQISYVPVAPALNDNQRSALCSFAFNCGANNLKKLCKDRTPTEIADAMLLYNKAAGKTLSGLTARRKDERTLFLSGMEENHDMDTLRRGDEGQQVKVLQKLLNRGLTVDGIFGGNTLDALAEFQGEAGLTVDGICGAETWEALLK
jgi:GH24 family phage-related lysozyme (muramidase)